MFADLQEKAKTNESNFYQVKQGLKAEVGELKEFVRALQEKLNAKKNEVKELKRRSGSTIESTNTRVEEKTAEIDLALQNSQQ